MSLSSSFPAVAQDRMHFINLGTCNAVIQCVLSIKDCLNERVFAESIDRMLESEPILRCQWIDSSLFPRWKEVGSDHEQQFQLLHVINLDQEMGNFMSAPLDPRTDSLIQIRIFRSYPATGARDTLCVKLSHVVSDLGGLRYLVYKLAETYAKLREDPDYRPAQAVLERSGWQVFFRLPFKQKIRLFQKGKKDFVAKGQWLIPCDRQSNEGMAYATRTLDGEKFLSLSRYARENRASLNLVMLAGFARALRCLAGVASDTSLPLMNTLDLRHYLRKERTPGACNLSVPLLLEVVFQADDTFEQTLAQLKSTMLEQKKSIPGVFQALSLEVLFLAPFFAVKKLLDRVFAEAAASGVSVPLFSDGGTAKVEIPGHTLLHSYGVGPITYAPAFMVTASTFEDTVTFAVGFCEASISRESIAHFFDLMVENLPLHNSVADGIGSASN